MFSLYLSVGAPFYRAVFFLKLAVMAAVSAASMGVAFTPSFA